MKTKIDKKELDSKEQKIEFLKGELKYCKKKLDWCENRITEKEQKIEELTKQNLSSDEANKRILTQILTKNTVTLKWYEIYVELGKLIQIKNDRNTQDILDATNKELTRLIKENYKPNK